MAPLLRMNLLQMIPVKLVLNVAVSRSSLHKDTITVIARLWSFFKSFIHSNILKTFVIK